MYYCAPVKSRPQFGQNFVPGCNGFPQFGQKFGVAAGVSAGVALGAGGASVTGAEVGAAWAGGAATAAGMAG